MALTHNISGIRPYLNNYLLNIVITDTVTGKLYSRQFSLDHSPDATEQDSWATLAKNRIQTEIDYEANEMNLREDQQRVLDYLDNILRGIIVNIRATPTVTLVQAQAYVDTSYPDSIVDFSKLYQFYLNLLNLSTWAEFKTFVIDHKFREVD